MRVGKKEAIFLVMALCGAGMFWNTLSESLFVPHAGPHPGLKDDALKQALRKNWDHKKLSYVESRRLIFGKVDGDGTKAECAYTGNIIKYISQPIANKGAMEHAWPMTRLPQEARSDLHHIFAVEGEARLARVNLKYGNVLVPVWSSGGSRSGPSRSLKPVFEVRPQKRGDIARAMFYVSTMYNLNIDADEERVLRKWHAEDPVSSEEKRRNGKISMYQRSRNPFIDHVSLVNRIKDF